MDIPLLYFTSSLVAFICSLPEAVFFIPWKCLRLS